MLLTEGTIAVVVISLATAVGVATFGGDVAEFLVATGESVTSNTNLMPLFGVNPMNK